MIWHYQGTPTIILQRKKHSVKSKYIVPFVLRTHLCFKRVYERVKVEICKERKDDVSVLSKI